MTEPTPIGKTITSPSPIEKSVAQQIKPKPPAETSSLERVSLPRISILFCTQCKWMLRAAYVRLSDIYLSPLLNLSHIIGSSYASYTTFVNSQALKFRYWGNHIRRRTNDNCSSRRSSSPHLARTSARWRWCRRRGVFLPLPFGRPVLVLELMILGIGLSLRRR
jgi:hypothetical protein